MPIPDHVLGQTSRGINQLEDECRDLRNRLVTVLETVDEQFLDARIPFGAPVDYFVRGHAAKLLSELTAKLAELKALKELLFQMGGLL